MDISILLASLLAIIAQLLSNTYSLKVTINILVKQISYINLEKKKLHKEVIQLKRMLSKCSCHKNNCDKLLTSPENVKFYTGLQSMSLFSKLHDFISPYVKRRWRGIKLASTKLKRQFTKNPKPQGQDRKLKSQDEFLMLLMRLRLNLLIKDLAQRFNVSNTLTSYITTSWLRAAAKVLKSFVFIPSQGTLNVTKPPQFDVVRNLHSIIDGTEIFIQTPKDHRLQKIHGHSISTITR